VQLDGAAAHRDGHGRVSYSSEAVEVRVRCAGQRGEQDKASGAAN
jgi:hypothetical protein